MTDGERLESLLRSALTPVEPPEALSDRLERALSELTEAAAVELADLDPAEMRDPRNWVRPAAAVVVGSLAGGALVVVRARQRQRKRGGSLRSLERAVREVADDLEKRLRG
ncbi:MAG: hypothetical protein H0U84_04270 [Thermoleophilaceae bacterium]|nr:hypothetical protein [Thermoleophilaceae bacterium]